MKKIILDLCGGTGSWSKPYLEAGYPVIKITLPEYDILKAYCDEESIHFPHMEMPETIVPFNKIYGILAAPPCTQFSFARTKAKKPRDLEEGMKIVKACLDLIYEVQYKLESDQQKNPPLKFWALENPYWGMLRWFLGDPAFVFNPYEFGDRYQKQTALWGYFKKPKKNPIQLTSEEKYKFGRHSQSLPALPEGYKHGDTNNRAAARAMTPPKFAKAFMVANQ